MYEINKLIVFSTSHIDRETQDFLINEVNQWVEREDKAGLIIKADEYSWQILADNSHHNNDDFEKIPQKLLELQKIAQENDCKWLVLDQDGPEYENLEVFDW